MTGKMLGREAYRHNGHTKAQCRCGRMTCSHARASERRIERRVERQKVQAEIREELRSA